MDKNLQSDILRLLALLLCVAFLLGAVVADSAEIVVGEPLYALFDEFVEEYSEDPGSFSYPEGYLFQHYDMVPEFSDACEKLQIGQVSGIVETEYGFHIILRLPLDYDNGVPISLANQGQYYTLRQLAVFDDFDNLYLLWLDSLDIVYSPELEALDLATLFAYSGDLLGIDAIAAMETYPPDTVMLSAGNLAVTWGLFYYILYNTAAQVTYGFQDYLDWHEISPYGNTWGDLVKDYVIDQCVQVLVFLYGAEANGVYIDEDDFEELQAIIDEMIAGAESIESLERELRDAGLYSLAAYEDMLQIFTLQDKLPVALYGENLDEIPDDAVAEFAEREGFMRAKHILRMFPPEGSDETKEDVYAEMEDILAQIDSRNANWR